MRPVIVLSALLAASPAVAQDASPVGIWKLVSLTLQFEGEAPIEFFGPNPRGYLIITRDNRLMTVITSSNRQQGATEADKAALFDSMNAYTGRFAVNGDTLTTTVEVASQEAWVGGQQVRRFKVEGNRLLITAPPQPSARRSDHKMYSQQIVWERSE